MTQIILIRAQPCWLLGKIPYYISHQHPYIVGRLTPSILKLRPKMPPIFNFEFLDSDLTLNFLHVFSAREFWGPFFELLKNTAALNFHFKAIFDIGLGVENCFWGDLGLTLNLVFFISMLRPESTRTSPTVLFILSKLIIKLKITYNKSYVFYH